MHKKKNLETTFKCYCLLKEWKGGTKHDKQYGTQHCASLNCRLVMQTYNTKSSMIHTLKSSFETYKNALKNMYIDIFICIQIGPLQQKTNTHTIHMSEFCLRRLSTEMDVNIGECE